MTPKVRTVPRPLACSQVYWSERHWSQCARDGIRQVLQSEQRMRTRRPSMAASQNGFDASSASGRGFSIVASVTLGSCSVRVRAEDEAGVVAEAAAVTGREDEVVLLDLAVAALAAPLDDRLAERGHAPHVVAGELAAAGVGRERTARAELAVLDERAALAL